MKTIPENIILRDGTYDRLIWESVYVNNEYKLPERFEPGDVVIDIGAHTGSFAAACLERGASVVCYEAYVLNFEVLNNNLPFNRSCVGLNVAVWSDDEPGRTLPITGYEYAHELEGLNTGGVTVLRGNDLQMNVESRPLNRCIARACTSFGVDFIRLIKLDCEGSEFPILMHAQDLSKVREICGEYHEGYGHKKVELVAALEGHGFTVETTGPTSEGLGHFWARRAA